MSDPTRYRVANNQAQLTLGGGILAVDPAGPIVEYSDYARLKAEVERYKFTLEEERQIARQDWAGLRCEHDRVKRALEQTEEHNEALCERLQDLNSEVHTASCHNANLHKENARLKAEVERLRKELAEAQENYHLVNEMVARLRKEGKQP